MKTLFVSLISCLTTLSVVAQSNSTLTVTVRGNQTEQVIIDGKSYIVNTDNNDVNGRSQPITVTDLNNGQHTLQLVRTDNYGDNTTSTAYFNLRTGYDLQIVITPNGSIQQRETRWGSTSNSGYASPMSASEYNVLYNSIRNQWRTSTRLSMLNDAFANTGNYFTVAQAMQLIQLINSQSSRLSLAKASYRTITDPSSFSQMYSLLNSQAFRNELQDYVNNYNASNSGTSSTGMSSTRFNTIYRTAQRQTSTSGRVSYISNIFSTTTNYYSAAQARQLIQLVTGESNRLYLAKISYRGITDQANFYRIHELLNSQASRDELTTYINTYNGTSNGNTGTATGTAMSASEFNSLYADVQNRFGLNAKMSRLTDIFNSSSYYFNVAQAEQLIRLVSSERNRLDLAKLSYNNIVDQYNFTQLYDVLSSQASRNELDAYVRSAGNQTGTGYDYNRTPMTDASFNSMYSDVSNTWGLGAKMSRLTDIFNNESNYFTVAQAKKLIQLVSSESNRLQLAKSSYGNITDPQNFSSMYDVLSSQSSRDELAQYVNNYSYNQ